MASYTIHGQRPLKGTIAVSGAKNDALKLLAASLLTKQTCVIQNVPDIADVRSMILLLKKLGVKVKQPDPHTYELTASDIKTTAIDPVLSKQLRASILLVAPLLARFGEVTLTHPGGCVIGKRPIDMFLDGYRALGAQIKYENEAYHMTAKRLRGATIVLPWISHTVTDSLLMAATLARGTTTIVNAAMEPEVENLGEMLQRAGAQIHGNGTHTIKITGVPSLHGAHIRTIPDRLEAGTFAIIGALLARKLTITGVQTAHLDVFWETLRRIGVDLSIDGSTVTVVKSPKLTAKEIRTHEYPGLATDLQPPLTVLLTQADGMSLVHDPIYEGRLLYTDLLGKMGAHIILADPHRAVVEGPTQLFGGKLISPDIRAGMALVIAALAAKGVSTIQNIELIDRGYEKIDERLRAVGAHIERTS